MTTKKVSTKNKTQDHQFRSSRYGVFIIESLRSDDYFDGENLNEILKLSLIPSKYRWVDSAEEFENAIIEFKKSGFRYLHISCHGDKKSIDINGEEITSDEIYDYFSTNIENKRVFIASCEGGNKSIASPMIKLCKATSVAGSPTILDFDKSAIFWPVFYHIIPVVRFKQRVHVSTC